MIVLFYSGVQKVLYGTYFDAQFLGLSIGHKPGLAWLFSQFLPADEMARLRALHPLAPGNGPYAIRSPLALLIANGVYVFEMATPVLLVWRRTWPYAVVAVLIVIAGIEVGARELLFGVLFVNLLLLFFARPVNRTLLPRRSPSRHSCGGARRPAAVLRLQLTSPPNNASSSPRRRSGGVAACASRVAVRYDLDPWRFFGWAMYCTLKLPADIHLFTVENGVRVPVEPDR